MPTYSVTSKYGFPRAILSINTYILSEGCIMYIIYLNVKYCQVRSEYLHLPMSYATQPTLHNAMDSKYQIHI